jgi:peptidoglycan/LPS O-acetylase OafA/YrhL
VSTPSFDGLPPGQEYPTAQIPAVQGYTTPDWPYQPVREPQHPGREVALAAGAAAVIAALGLALGAVWSAVAPWVPALRTADGAVLAQPEQEQMVAGEGWYLIITVLAGIVVAVLAWVLLRRHRGVPVLLGVVVGAIAGGILAYWLGHHIGLAHARYLADHAAVGTTFSIPPNLRAQQVGLWHGWLPYAKGDVLAMAIAAVVTYILLAGFSQYPTLRPAPAATDPADGPAAPVNSGW